LRDIDCFSNGSLGQISILAQGTDTLIFLHNYHQIQYMENKLFY
jgi:hypothetical protein